MTARTHIAKHRIDTARPSAASDVVDESAHLGLSRGARRTLASAVALIGAGTAVTALAAPASATPSYTSVWEDVAQCESSGDWSIDTGNGFYGGVQFTSSTWGAYGGHKYASQANGASEREQIEVARRALDGQGPGAWPVCGARAGLTRSNGGATDAALPASDESIAHADAVAKAKAAADAKAKAAAAAKTTTPAPTTTQPTTAQPTTTTPAVTRPSPTPRTDTQLQRYVVQAGDTLSAIVERLGEHKVGTTWQQLAALNKATLSDPDLLQVGQVLHVPTS